MSIFNSLGSNYDLPYILKGWLFGEGENIEKLEKYLSQKYQGKVYLTYKGREALYLALKLAKLPPGSFVAINGFTCYAVFEAIKDASLNIEYLDIKKDGLNFSAQSLEKSLRKNKKIRAVILQNTLGFPADAERIAQICKKNNLILIEDLAHSVGTIYLGQKLAGEVGDLVVFSFSQDKVVDGVSGGALVVKNLKFKMSKAPAYAVKNLKFKKVSEEIENKNRWYPLLTYLIRKTYPFFLGRVLHFLSKTFNFLLDPMKSNNTSKTHQLLDMNCYLINLSFDNLEKQLTHRRTVARIYKKNLDTNLLPQFITLETIAASTNLRFPIFVSDREGLIKYLRQNGVYLADIWYDGPIAPRRFLDRTDYVKGGCPNAERVAKKILNLPTHINLSEIGAKRICELVNNFYA